MRKTIVRLIMLIIGAPEEIQTPDPQIRSLVTPNYPADRSSRGAAAVLFSNSFAARGLIGLLLGD